MMTIMRDLVITQNSTADGVIEATDDWFALTGEQVSADQVAALQWRVDKQVQRLSQQEGDAGGECQRRIQRR